MAISTTKATTTAPFTRPYAAATILFSDDNATGCRFNGPTDAHGRLVSNERSGLQ
jgi:hypothetical protein